MLVLPISQNSAWFEFTCELDGIAVTLTFRWNDRSERWFFDLSDAQGNILAASLAAVVGAPLLNHLHHLPGVPPGELLVLDTGNRDEDPSYDSIGRRHVMLYGTTAEIAAASTPVN